MAYLNWSQVTVDLTDSTSIAQHYDSGFLLTRLPRIDGNAVMVQTRSVRVRLEDFSLSSENKRIIKLGETAKIHLVEDPTELPMDLGTYQRNAQGGQAIHSMGAKFYTEKFGEGTFSANALFALCTDPTRTSFNLLLRYVYGWDGVSPDASVPYGYAICYQNPALVHYAYPFYDLTVSVPTLGMGMMLKAVVWAQETGKEYVYLGSAQRPEDTYKLQFSGIEWFDGEVWQTDVGQLKDLLRA